MHALITKKFKTISRAAQMHVWHKFKAFTLDDHPLSASITSKLCNLATEWKSLKFTFTEDTFLGFVLQDSIGQALVVAQDFTCWIESLVQADPEKPTPTSEKLVHLLGEFVVNNIHLHWDWYLNLGHPPFSPSSPCQSYNLPFPQQPLCHLSIKRHISKGSIRMTGLRHSISTASTPIDVGVAVIVHNIFAIAHLDQEEHRSIVVLGVWELLVSAKSDLPTVIQFSSFPSNHRSHVHATGTTVPAATAILSISPTNHYQQPYHQQQFQGYAPPSQNNYPQPRLRPEYPPAPPQQHRRSQQSN
ncbi:hypothetical protein PSTG_09308 [Puccinia striiformis f. sp. tritici PST-78]|uniref:Uncharacterized protein n=1 Tax=Puccinia striiformis f. sp. tritici PST-78 TaxID=1165861 RepID=A0A0L0VE78_9BASI|nr:hypothetical protein PSTG_09308 [Puccinia striiformis f. sp. tritici PST-78]